MEKELPLKLDRNTLRQLAPEPLVDIITLAGDRHEQLRLWKLKQRNIKLAANVVAEGEEFL